MPTVLPRSRLRTGEQQHPVGLTWAVVCLSGLLCFLALARICNSEETAADQTSFWDAGFAEPLPSILLAP